MYYIDLLSELVEELISQGEYDAYLAKCSSVEDSDEKATYEEILKRYPDSFKKEASGTSRNFSDKQTKVWVLFANSVLTGEFLKKDGYSNTLEIILKRIQDKYKKEANNVGEVCIRPFLHPLLPVLYELCFKLRHICHWMRIQISLNSRELNQIISITSHNQTYWGQYYNKGENSPESLDAKRFYNLGSLLLEMTRIDLSGIISDISISQLSQLYGLCEDIRDSENYKTFVVSSIFTECSTSGRPIRALSGTILADAIAAKCSLLAFQSIVKSHIIISNDGSLSIEDQTPKTFRRLDKIRFLFDSKSYNSVDSFLSDEKLNFWKKNLLVSEKITNKREDSSSEEEGRDLESYSLHIKKSGENEEKYSSCIEKIKEATDLDEIKKIYDDLNARSTFMPFHFLIKVMWKLKSLSEKGYTFSYGKGALILGELLGQLEDMIIKYGEVSQPYGKRRTFKESFFRLKDFRKDQPEIFISSFNCRPININYLKDYYLAYYSHLHRKWIEQETIDYIERVEKIKETVESELKSYTEEKLKEEATTLRRETITILGIFAAMLTLAVSLVSTFRLADNIYDFLIMLSSSYIFIALLVFFLFLKKMDNSPIIVKLRKDETEREVKCKINTTPSLINHVSGSIIGAIFIAVLGFVLKILCNPHESEQKSDGGINISVEQKQEGRSSIVNNDMDAIVLTPKTKVDHKKK